ncbi:MAG: PIG-L family deacetylase, partial [Acidimicrobiales bacterium]
MSQKPYSDLRILTIHAHPDDESSKGAATIARYKAGGAATVLVCATGGEEGDILNPVMDREEVTSDLKAWRRGELDEAARIIGYDEVIMLGYRDSGMDKSDANAHPDSFWQAPVDQAVDRLVSILRAERPHVVVTY